MSIALPARAPTAVEVAALPAHRVAELMQGYEQTIGALKHQLEWFKRQLFGQKSERFAPRGGLGNLNTTIT